ncbi:MULTISPECIES: MarR family transcriptional regulator [Rhizobium/Agrobacterium group]|uniref:MarR family winged helix-turn-helix transcriptional regulator n=1 Tax=Rhizobium/Agrobacterium group TaxID=227290 RepID=UPI000D880785|nr:MULTISPECIES: MarR family transcriptional regulator [Rhizobium/Agrobacterium group]MBO0125637.1 MarR family transcriptional regulator [Agrobacterium sp. OT33]PYG55658.1 DNA-binding MarR family transcriptional regulator [Rhizobium sp. UGM030330-04]UXT49387.1 MarR family transcriptional regulator [Agrobacterium tumefaciens]
MPPKHDAWLKLAQAVGNVESDLGKAMQTACGLGLSEYRALEALFISPDGELRMQDLAAHLCLNQSSVSRLVERLERTGLTVRDLCPDDKRGVYTVLTDNGRARIESARQVYEHALGAAIKQHGCETALAAQFSPSGPR